MNGSCDAKKKMVNFGCHEKRGEKKRAEKVRRGRGVGRSDSRCR